MHTFLSRQQIGMVHYTYNLTMTHNNIYIRPLLKISYDILTMKQLLWFSLDNSKRADKHLISC